MRAFSKIILIVITLSILSNALHLHDVSSNYIAYLQGQQNTVKGKLDALSQKLSQDYKAV